MCDLRTSIGKNFNSMGNLLEQLVHPSPSFSHTSVDYAGRVQRTRKHNVALFVCLATKAIHLEIVKDYTTPGFLTVFRRFVSRRGLPAHM